MALGNNIKKRRKQLGLKQAELAKLVGTTQGTISALENRDSKSSALLPELSRALQMSANDLSQPSKRNQAVAKYHAEGGASHGKVGAYDFQKFDTVAYIPIIEWDKAHLWGTEMGLNTPELFVDKAPRVSINPRVFGLRTPGNSMTSPVAGETSFLIGEVLFFDPDQRSPRNGDYVVVKRKGQCEPNCDTIFRKYTINDQGEPCLKALNPDYPCIHDDYTILGKFIGKWTEP